VLLGSRRRSLLRGAAVLSIGVVGGWYVAPVTLAEKSNAATQRLGSSCNEPATLTLTKHQISVLGSLPGEDDYRQLILPVPGHPTSQIVVLSSVAFADDTSVRDGIYYSLVGTTGSGPEFDPCELVGADSEGRTFAVPSARLGLVNGGGAGAAEIVSLPSQLTRLAIRYAAPRTDLDGKSCLNPYVAWYSGDTRGYRQGTNGALTATQFRWKFPRKGDLAESTFTWHVQPGYRVCHVEIAQTGRPLYVSTAPSGSQTVVTDGAPIEHAYVTVRKEQKFRPHATHRPRPPRPNSYPVRDWSRVETRALIAWPQL
jgi:hypothetical protein